MFTAAIFSVKTENNLKAQQEKNGKLNNRKEQSNLHEYGWSSKFTAVSPHKSDTPQRCMQTCTVKAQSCMEMINTTSAIRLSLRKEERELGKGTSRVNYLECSLLPSPPKKKKKKKKKKICYQKEKSVKIWGMWISPVAQQVKDLVLSLQQPGCCRGSGSIPGPGTSTCLVYGQKKKKERFEIGLWRMLVISLSKTCLYVRNNSFKNTRNGKIINLQ